MSELRNFTVVERTSEPDPPDQNGNVSYFLKLEGVEKGVLLRHKKDKPIRSAGDVIEGYYLEEKTSQAGKQYFKLTRPQQPNAGAGNNGSRSKDPAERESIERQVAAKCATELLVGFMGTGWKPSTVNDLATQHQALAKQIAGEIKV